ncbi:MAG: UDP-N-acetylmuramate dehydrogenase [Candidatus Paracaedibacteraceae bacterium]|nr:UDP-N-acetylmuramate dehydrogenase [Candidatus Paracaedibacteraceae bacterium]
MLDILPQVRGRYTFDDLLSKHVWFRVGGAADVMFRPADLDDLIFFLKEKPSDLEVLTLGMGSNVLIRDKGLKGVVVRLARGFAECYIQEDKLIAGAGTLDRNVAFMAAKAGISGFEFLATIPGTIGGALKMNAGCYDSEIKDILLWVKAVDLQGNLKTYTVEELNYSYRKCGLTERVIFVEACFKASEHKPAKEIYEKIEKFLAQRELTQPTRTKTGGSTFKNPEGKKAWELIDQVGGRGLSFGGACFSEKHCNFLINTGTATAADIETLGELVRQRVFSQLGIELQWEIMRLGEA